MRKISYICMNCYHACEIDDMLFECRRYAPQRTHGVGTGENNQKFPIMRLDDWCGEFKPRESESE